MVLPINLKMHSNRVLAMFAGHSAIRLHPMFGQKWNRKSFLLPICFLRDRTPDWKALPCPIFFCCARFYQGFLCLIFRQWESVCLRHHRNQVILALKLLASLYTSTTRSLSSFIHFPTIASCLSCALLVTNTISKLPSMIIYFIFNRKKENRMCKLRCCFEFGLYNAN